VFALTEPRLQSGKYADVTRLITDVTGQNGHTFLRPRAERIMRRISRASARRTGSLDHTAGTAMVSKTTAMMATVKRYSISHIPTLML